MWLFAKRGFLSVVEDINDNNRLLVRGRVDGDIEKCFPNAAVFHTPENDYGYRTFLPRTGVAAILSNTILKIDYPNFKANIEDRELRAEYYGAVWRVMHQMQADLNR